MSESNGIAGTQPSFDAVIVPGGGLREGGRLPPWVENRLDRALDLAKNAYIVTLSAGTPHKPPLDSTGCPILESVAEAAYLHGRGFPAERLLIENASYDTIGNAYFARVMHIDPAGFKRLCIVTSFFHLPRTEAIFRWMFGLSGGPRSAYELTFVGTPDVGMTTEVLQKRREKEQQSLRSVQELRRQYTTLAAFHKWLFTTHAAYSLEKPPRAKADPLLLETY